MTLATLLRSLRLPGTALAAAAIAATGAGAAIKARGMEVE